MFDISPYAAALFIHLAAAIVLVGGTLMAPFAAAAMRGAASTSELRRWLEFTGRVHRWTPASAFVLLASGVYLGAAGWWTQGWFYVSIGAWVANSLLAILIVNASERAMRSAIEQAGEGPVHGEVERLRSSPRVSRVHWMMVANDFTILYVMVQKPGWLECLLLLCAANLAVAAMTAIGRRNAARGSVTKRPAAVH